MSAAIPYPWQQDTWLGLCQRIEAEALPHGLLLSGQSGLGKSQLARCLAEYLLCLKPANERACGSCKGCELVAAGTHPDLHWVMPDEPGKAIKIEHVRSLNHFLGQTAQQGGYRVAVLEPAEAMNINAANALLKNLEEPGANTLLVLLADNPSRVMATLRSRCQAIALPTPNAELASRWLAPLCGDHQPEQLLAMCGGAPLAARDLLHEGRLEQRQAFAKDLSAIASGQQFALQAVGNWLEPAPLFLLECLLGWLQAAARLQAGHSGAPALGPEQGLIEALAQRPAKISFRLYDKLLKAKAQILSGANPNQQLLLEELALDWQALSRARVA
ncbi:MAG: DNA polymerase III subunit delta' [Cellvibrionaceae bacterium]|nr:DNA polymerase III subunit delta' [Cellvibrionaceae bacterium]